jgi:hypothetical protein
LEGQVIDNRRQSKIDDGAQVGEPKLTLIDFCVLERLGDDRPSVTLGRLQSISPAASTLRNFEFHESSGGVLLETAVKIYRRLGSPQFATVYTLVSIDSASGFSPPKLPNLDAAGVNAS